MLTLNFKTWLAANSLLAMVQGGVAKVGSSKPQMGWNSWNSFKARVTSEDIRDAADKIVSLGLKDVGYEYVVVDEGWQDKTRGPDSRQRANATTFPGGIPELSTYVHSKGLKIGIYSDAGIFDCGFSPGSWGYEELDTQTYASWEVDYLKYDNCGTFEAGVNSPFERFSKMGDSLLLSGRDIFYSMCQWGNQFPWFWADQVGHSYRISGDIHNSFSSDNAGVCKTAYCLNTGYAGCSVLTIMRKMREIAPFQGPNSWADMDMMYVGMGGMTGLEEQTHFSFWAALKSPLIIGADLTNISSQSVGILKNKDLIAINQDPLGKAVNYVPSLSTEGSLQVWIGPLSRNRFVALVFNEGNSTANATLPAGNLGAYVLGYNGSTVSKNSSKIWDVWYSQALQSANGSLALNNIGSHETRVLVVG